MCMPPAALSSSLNSHDYREGHKFSAVPGCARTVPLPPQPYVIYIVFQNWTLPKEVISQVFMIKMVQINICPILEGYGFIET